MARSQWVCDDVMRMILAAMMPANRLAIECSLVTGLRISDVLSLHTDTIRKTQRPYVKDSKTGKTHRIYLPVELRQRLLQQAGTIWVFEGRSDARKHRTRGAVYKDMTQAAAIYRRSGLTDVQHISPHSARKVAAVRAYKRGGLDAAQAMLVHDPDHPLVTMIYALSDQMPPSSDGAASAAVPSPRAAPKGAAVTTGRAIVRPCVPDGVFCWAARARVAQDGGSAVYIGAAYIVAYVQLYSWW